MTERDDPVLAATAGTGRARSAPTAPRRGALQLAAIASIMPVAGDPPATPASADDTAVVRRMATGDAAALGPLYDRWSPHVQRVVAAILRSPGDVEDVVEEVFWQAWRQAGRFDAGRGTVSAWLTTMARSRAMDRAKAIRRRPEDAVAGPIAAARTDSPDPADQAIASDRRSIVAAALGELPRAQREALEMAYFGGLTQMEIAACTGQPLGTIKTRMRLAMQKLRERLAPTLEVAR